jgi:cystathionine gamma-synthase
MTSTDTPSNQRNILGAPVPDFTPHAISVSLPTWKDNVGYEEGEERVVKAMVNGYPRFFIHLSIRKVRAVVMLSDYISADLGTARPNLCTEVRRQR